MNVAGSHLDHDLANLRRKRLRAGTRFLKHCYNKLHLICFVNYMPLLEMSEKKVWAYLVKIEWFYPKL
ncbi:conserved hypothetical protein [Culex quinquefasciatus]|uniref:Uncharacterized protein n=1 Tax=Culex quinquefasciatus TaxID=7176 RepID=B0X8D2_CULQU|nr:conserved hypothetical protein [Culex quinquefasciatus]|eukprot:XP_001865904.1 conserved hypothetical protein [Culex quinquefasciatus]